MTAKKKYSNCDEVYKSLQKYFSSRTFEVGERVPSERQIAEDLKVNRTTLRTAMHRMVKDGLLDRHVGVGTFFRVSPEQMFDNYARINTKCNFLELVEARLMLEPKLAYLAALNIKDDDIPEIKELCKISESTHINEVEQIDIKFYEVLSNKAANSILKEIYMVVSDLRKKHAGKLEENTSCNGFDCVIKWRELQDKIIRAIEKHDPKAAYEAVNQKLDVLIGLYSIVNR